MSSEVHGTLRLSVDLSKWEHGFEALSVPHVAESARREWDLAVEVLFAATQQVMHVDSGDLLSTGRFETSVEGNAVIGDVIYGGGRRSDAKPWWKHPNIDYAKYELRRKGSHDFFGRGMKMSRRRLEEGAGKMLEAAFKEAFGGL